MTSTVVLCLMFGFGKHYTSTDITGNDSAFCNIACGRDPFQGQMNRGAHSHQNKQTNEKKGLPFGE